MNAPSEARPLPPRLAPPIDPWWLRLPWASLAIHGPYLAVVLLMWREPLPRDPTAITDVWRVFPMLPGLWASYAVDALEFGGVGVEIVAAALATVAIYGATMWLAVESRLPYVIVFVISCVLAAAMGWLDVNA